jgi:hypothetical protein
MAHHNSLDDLPERPTEHVNSDIARQRFRQLFTDPLFIVREETDNDYGVDICIEALVNNGTSPTNIRAHVQLKASSKKRNTDGTYSYSVSRRNLNYLLNSPGSFYAFYSTTTGAFYYRSADDVYHEYESGSKEWATQGTVTIKFREALDNKSIALIHENLVTSAMIFKEFRLQLRMERILPGAKFVYGELHFESSDTLFHEYQEANDIQYVYTMDEEGKVIFLHNLVWEAAHGPIPRGYQVYHINGDTLDNTRANLDIVKTAEIFPLGEFQAEVEAAQAYNIIAVITEGAEAELTDAPPPHARIFERVLGLLRSQGWIATDSEISELKSLLVEKLDMKL